MPIDNKYLDRFQQDGYIILKGLINLQPIEIWKESFHQFIQRVKPIRRPPNRGLGGQVVIDNLVEHEPKMMLPAVTNSVISRQVDAIIPETKLWQMWIQEDKAAKQDQITDFVG